MEINANNTISILEATKDFSKVVDLVDSNGSIVILKDNKPEYVITKYSEYIMNENDFVELIARRILSEHKYAFEELAKF